jgi:phenylalanyl-tRNA synthetase beta chain
VVGAVLRGVRLDRARYDSFIDLQDKLHANIARKRTLVAIGTHDLDTLRPPFTYDAKPPTEIEFVPLAQRRSFRADALVEFYRTDPTVKHIKPYVDIIASSPVYPVITDAAGTVLSLPPLINGDHSKITLATTNIFVECTATDLTKAHIVLDTVVTMFSEYASQPFAVEQVRVTYEEAPKPGLAEEVTPSLTTRTASARLSTLRTMLGKPDLTKAAAAELAKRMQLTPVEGEGDEGTLVVAVPPTRSDVLHECDVVEDVAMAFGFNNVPRKLPSTVSAGAQQPINKLSDALRRELAHAGWDESLTLALVSREENFAHMGLADPGDLAVELANPKTEDFQICRTAIVPGLLKCLAANASASFAAGVRLFEVTDVVLRDAASDTGARNERRVAALYSSTTAGFEVTHGLVDRIMRLLEVPVKPYAWQVPTVAAGSGAAAPAAVYGRGGLRYTVRPLTAATAIPTYFPGLGAQVVLQHEGGGESVIGSLGVLHPHVLKAFGLVYPVSVMEFNIQPFLLTPTAAPAAPATTA